MRTASTFAVFLLSSAAVYAQTPVASLPTGSAVSGWAVEVTQRDDRKPIVQVLGERGFGRVTLPSQMHSFEQVAQRVGANGPTSHNGRAFLRVTDAGTYTFGIRAVTVSSGTSTMCGAVLDVGGQRVVHAEPSIGKALNVPEGHKPFAVVGNVRLSAGVYPIEYAISCIEGYSVKASYDIQLRDPEDNALRLFKDNELFHIRR